MDPTIGRIELTAADVTRFMAKVGPPDERGCRMWLASLDARGYGQFRLAEMYDKPRTVKAHLVAWTIARGAFPAGLEPDHTCNIRCCVSADHLEWVTHAENNRRIALRATHCRSGRHRWDEQKLLKLMNGKRECRECRNERKRLAYAES